MTDQSLPTRSQMELAMEFISSFIGAAYEDEGVIDLEVRRVSSTHGEIPEKEWAGYMEKWLRDHTQQIVDGMVESDCALEDTEPIEDKRCPREDAHGPHYWPRFILDKQIEFHCEGLSVHPRCMIAGGRNEDA